MHLSESYPEFMTDPHPALRHAVTVDLVTGKRGTALTKTRVAMLRH